MSRQVETAPAAVVEGAGVAVMTEATRPPVVDRGLVAQLVGDAQRQGLSVDLSWTSLVPQSSEHLRGGLGDDGLGL